MNRRRCLQSLGALGLGSLLAPNLRAASETGSPRHILLDLNTHPELSPPEDLVTGFSRFGWESFPLGEGDEGVCVLAGLGDKAPEVPDDARCRFRLTTALDIREPYRIAVSTPSGKSLGEFDLRYAGLFQVQEISLTPEQARLLLAEGAVLKIVSGPGSVWFFAPSPKASPAPDPVQLPHVMIASPEVDAAQQFEERLHGLVMLQGFGWQSGCVSEGILDLAELRQDAALFEAVDRYLAMYFTEDGVIFENPRSERRHNTLGSIEETLPWATLVRRHPEHPAIEVGREFLSSTKVNQHRISYGQSLSTEGCYTTAYPTARLAKVLKSPELELLALRHLEARRLTNIHDGQITQRATMGGTKHFHNWCRGVCWYFLGIVRTIETIGDKRVVESWLPEIRRVASFVLKLQRENGLWGNYVDNPQSVADTSGSAGIAAALARAHAAGWLPDESRDAARRTLAELKNYYTPDGLLGGAAQANKGGEALQESDHRVVYQMAMGLKAQLMAAV